MVKLKMTGVNTAVSKTQIEKEIQNMIMSGESPVALTTMATTDNKTSSLIKHASYDPLLRVMLVEFETNVYLYNGVPRQVWEEFVKADSLGKFFNKNIKPNFKGVKINEENTV